MFIYVGGGAGTRVVVHIYKMASVVSSAKIVKAGFHSFRSILDQNALLKASQTSRKCAQEFSSGKEWVLRCLQDTFGGR